MKDNFLVICENISSCQPSTVPNKTVYVSHQHSTAWEILCRQTVCIWMLRASQQNIQNSCQGENESELWFAALSTVPIPPSTCYQHCWHEGCGQAEGGCEQGKPFLQISSEYLSRQL